MFWVLAAAAELPEPGQLIQEVVVRTSEPRHAAPPAAWRMPVAHPLLVVRAGAHLAVASRGLELDAHDPKDAIVLVTPDGVTHQSFPLPFEPAGLIASPDRLFVSGIQGQLLAMDHQGTIQWSLSARGHHREWQPLALLDDTIYQAASKPRAVHIDTGETMGWAPHEPTFTVPVAGHGGWLVPAEGAIRWYTDLAGEPEWSVRTSTSVHIASTETGWGIVSDRLVSLHHPDGTTRFSAQPAAPRFPRHESGVRRAPGHWPRGHLVVAQYNEGVPSLALLTAYSKHGIQWSVPLPERGSRSGVLMGDVAPGEGKEAVLGTVSGEVFAVQSNGRVAWRWKGEGEVRGKPLLLANGEGRSLVIFTTGNELVCLTTKGKAR